MNRVLAELPDVERDQLESWLVEFDRTWDQAKLDDSVDSLPFEDPGLRLATLTEMVKIDLERQWRSDRLLTVDDYLARFPELGTPETVTVDLIRVELDMRGELGEPLDDQELAMRFPGRVDEIDDAEPTGVVAGVDRLTVAPGLRFESSEVVDLPEVFGRYRILRQIGRGSMGVVWLAYDEELERQVAVKVPNFESTDDGSELIERFYREARAAAKLNHPNICPVHDVGEIDGIHFSTMVFIEGDLLSEYISPETLQSERHVVTVVRKLALALRYAHAHGIIHRDLKPKNVMIDERGEPIVMDFGLARRIDNLDADTTRLGMMIGTPAFMSPEQVNGDHNLVGPASDVYSLGVILYQLLAGRLPFQGTVTAVIGQIVNSDIRPPPPSRFRQKLDPRLESICLTAMAKSIDERYSSMEEFAAALKTVLQQPPVVEPPRPSASRTAKLTGATRSVSLRRKVTCPHCWHTFPPDATLWITAHPELRGDSLLGDDVQQRFLPSRFNEDCRAIDVKGVVCRELACPRCHLSLPRALLEMESLFLSILGAPFSGKSYFLTAMTWRLRQRLSSEFRLSFGDADPVANQILSDYEGALFLNSQDDQLVSLRKTEKEGDLYESVRFGERTVWYPRPFVFTVQPEPDHPASQRMRPLSRAVCLYDNAGEHFLPGGELPHSPATQHLALSSVLLFLFDPTQHPRFREVCRDYSDDPQFDQQQWIHRQDQVLLEAAHRIRSVTGLPQNARDPRPLIVIVTKYDAWWSLAKFQPLESNWVVRPHSSGLCGLYVDGLQMISQQMREILMEYSPELVAAAEGFSEDVIYVPVSALGHGPERDATGALGVRPRDIDPMWAEVPMLYALHRSVPGLVPKITPQGNGRPADEAREAVS